MSATSAITKPSKRRGAKMAAILLQLIAVSPIGGQNNRYIPDPACPLPAACPQVALWHFACHSNLECSAGEVCCRPSDGQLKTCCLKRPGPNQTITETAEPSHNVTVAPPGGPSEEPDNSTTQPIQNATDDGDRNGTTEMTGLNGTRTFVPPDGQSVASVNSTSQATNGTSEQDGRNGTAGATVTNGTATLAPPGGQSETSVNVETDRSTMEASPSNRTATSAPPGGTFRNDSTTTNVIAATVAPPSNVTVSPGFDDTPSSGTNSSQTP